MHHFEAHELADSWELRAGLLDEDPADASISACLRECAAALRNITTPSPAPAHEPIGYLCRHRANVADAIKAFGPDKDLSYLWSYTHGTAELELMERCAHLEVVRVYGAVQAPAVVDGAWVEVTPELLASQANWLYQPMWIALKSGRIAQGVYEWRQGQQPDRFIGPDVGDEWALSASHVMPIKRPAAPSSDVPVQGSGS